MSWPELAAGVLAFLAGVVCGQLAAARADARHRPMLDTTPPPTSFDDDSVRALRADLDEQSERLAALEIRVGFAPPSKG